MQHVVGDKEYNFVCYTSHQVLDWFRWTGCHSVVHFKILW